MRIIGIDPGLKSTGWGILDFTNNKLKHVSNGTCKTNEKDDISERLLKIFLDLTKVFESFSPNSCAIESTFVNKDVAGALKLGQARGVALMTAASAGIKVFEYAPRLIKKAVTGVGTADKNQVKKMIEFQLPGIIIKSNDASDAIGVALCHAFHYNYLKKAEQM